MIFSMSVPQTPHVPPEAAERPNEPAPSIRHSSIEVGKNYEGLATEASG